MNTFLPLSSLALAALLPSASLAETAPGVPASPPVISQGAPSQALAPAAEPAEQDDPMKLARTSFDAMKAVLALLQTVVDKSSADAAAPGLLEETEKQNDVTRTLAGVNFEGLAYDEEAYMELVPRIFAVSEKVNDEFARLERAGWFGSEALKQAVEEANKPVFSDEDAAASEGGEPARPLTPEQEKAELARMRALVPVDSELLDALKQVSSASVAAVVVPALKACAAKLEELQPTSEAVGGYFENPDDSAVAAAYKPVNDLMQQVRAELLRIVALDGFQTKEFDPFNDAMDEVFRMLESTHDFWYSDVFDENFEDAVFDILDKKSGGKTSGTPAA